MSRWTTTSRMREGERVGDFHQQPHRLVHRQLALARDPVPERLALDVRHDVVEETFGLAGVEQRQDMRVLQPGRDPDFTGEALRAQGRGELGPEHLDGHLALVLRIVGEEDRGHPALAELALHVIARAQRSL